MTATLRLMTAMLGLGYFGAIEDWPKTPEETLELGIRAGLAAKARAEAR